MTPGRRIPATLALMVLAGVTVVSVLLQLSLFAEKALPARDTTTAQRSPADCVQLRSNVHAHTTITLSIIAELVFGKRPASVVIAEQAQALWIADEQALWTIFYRKGATPSGRSGSVNFDRLWDYGSAPSELQVTRQVFLNFGFTAEDAMRYMKNRRPPVRIELNGTPPNYYEEMEKIRKGFLDREERLIRTQCPQYLQCFRTSVSLQRVTKELRPRRRAPRTTAELDRYVKLIRPDMQALAAQHEQPKIAALFEFWNHPSSQALWDDCQR